MGITRTNRAVFSSLTQEWATPQSLFDELNLEFRFQIDVAASRKNAKCRRYFTRGDNALARRWTPLRCFMNPPYGNDLRLWMAKAVEEWRAGATVVCLVPARTDTQWWHDCVLANKVEVRFIRGRLRFNEFRDAKRRKRATFPSCVVVFRGKETHGHQHHTAKTARPKGRLQAPQTADRSAEQR
jgi:site-specific DNA-methyltransferase (adenine-specific)